MGSFINWGTLWHDYCFYALLHVHSRTETLTIQQDIYAMNFCIITELEMPFMKVPKNWR